jgi:hypothetical protein
VHNGTGAPGLADAQTAPNQSRAVDLFRECERAIEQGVPITRESARDKEFAAQNWIEDRLKDAGIPFTASGRNTYPDFPLEDEPEEGFEVKSLAFPGRDASYDANSQPPSGVHHGRTIYYVFVRYPKGNELSYPVHDLVICHGDLLNPMRDYDHENKNIPNFGGYADIMIRDRKMYVVKTPYKILDGIAGERTLILPEGHEQPSGLHPAGTFSRTEAEEYAVGYSFDLRTNEMTVQTEANPTGGKVHTFQAFRSEPGGPEVVVAST